MGTESQCHIKLQLVYHFLLLLQEYRLLLLSAIYCKSRHHLQLPGSVSKPYLQLIQELT